MDLKKAQEYIKALKNGEKFPKKNMFLIMFLLGALLFVIVLPTGSSAPTSEKGGLDENKRKEDTRTEGGGTGNWPPPSVYGQDSENFPQQLPGMEIPRLPGRRKYSVCVKC